MYAEGRWYVLTSEKGSVSFLGISLWGREQGNLIGVALKTGDFFSPDFAVGSYARSLEIGISVFSCRECSSGQRGLYFF